MISMASDVPFTLLLVCTGNICRSPVAERLAAVHLAETHGAGAVRVSSAGVRAVVGNPIDPSSARALVELGGDPESFRARQLTERLAAGADLTLTMTRAQRADVLAYAPRRMARTFTVREAAGLLELARPDESLPGDPAAPARALVRAMAAARPRRRSGPDDDIADPIGQDLDGHRSTARAVADALLPVLDRLTAALGGHDGSASSPGLGRRPLTAPRGRGQ
jgi:protein-tyrosine-phosphatase